MPQQGHRGSVAYPIKLTYIDRFTSWWPPAAIAEGLAVPGYTQGGVTLPFNYIALAFWTYGGGAVDAATVWSNPLYYIGAGVFGDTTQDIQTTLKAKYTAAGVKLLVSAFGATENPTSSGYDATDCANKLAQFVLDNQLDGVDIDWEDTPAFQKGDGSGENWLITLTRVLRSKLPYHIITHAPQAPYFVTNSSETSQYPKGAYLEVHRQVGSLIDFYNIQFYNQGFTMYETTQDLFEVAGGWAPGTAINEIIASGVPASMIVLGKPASPGDASNSYLTADAINAAIAANAAAHPSNHWKTGVMFWQYSSDQSGAFCNTATKALDSFYAVSREQKENGDGQ